MSGVQALSLILLWQAAIPCIDAALTVSTTTPQRAELGKDILLPCSFRLDGSINLQFLAVLWLFQGKEVVRFDNKGSSSHPRMSINTQDASKGIANMQIKNVTTADIGQYSCMVIYSPQKESKDIDLTVHASPSVTIETVQTEDMTMYALCSVTGFFPRDIAVDILRDDTITKDSVLSGYHTNADGTYSVNKTWKIPSDVSPKMLSCVVGHETPTPNIQKDLRLFFQEEKSNTTGVVIGCIVGVIIFALVIGFILWIYKRKSGEKFTVCDIESPVLIDGEKTSLSCRALHSSGEVQATWTIKMRDGTQIEVSDIDLGDNEEGQPLLSREYQVTKDCQKSPKHVTTKLTFIPSISRHLGSTVSCRIVHQKRCEEKTFDIKNIYAKPQFIEPVQITLSDGGDVQISVTLQRFYPQELEVSWFSRRGQSEEKIPSEDTPSHSGMTCNLESKCSVPGELFRDPSYKVIVRWKHGSMEESQSREISVRDLPWCPKLQNIPIESIFQGDKVLLQCRVSDYFPDALTVRWFEKKTGSQNLLEISNDQKYKIPEISSHRMENQTFSSTSVLSYKRSDLSEKGVEFICRVEHPTINTPIQSTIVQYRDTEATTFVLNNIQGPQTWITGEKVTLYCSALYCMEGTQVTWMVKAAGTTICDIGEDVRKDPHHSADYVAHRERTEESDKEGLQDVTSSLAFIPSISKHQNISIACKILCDGKVKEKTFQPQHLYAKPSVVSPIKLSLTGSGEVLCSLDIEGLYPRDILIKWNDKESSEPVRTSQNSDGTYSVHSVYKLPGRYFSQPDATVRVSWKHESMENWEDRKVSVRDKEFPWKVNVQDILVPNLLDGSTATLKCEVSNVFPDVLSVRWLKKEKDSDDVFPLIHNETYNISELRPEKQKDNTFMYKSCMKFKPSKNTDDGAEIICRVEHPTLEGPAEKSTGPLTIIEEKKFIVGDIQGPPQWIHGKKTKLSCPLSYCCEDTRVMWMVNNTDGSVEKISDTGRDSATDSDYMISEEKEESDKEGLINIISSLTFIPSVSKHLGVIITCRVSSDGETKTKEFKPKPIYATPQVVGPVKTSLCDGGGVLCSLILQNFYPKHMKFIWKSGEKQLKSTEVYDNNDDGTYNGHSDCIVPGNLLTNPNFSLEVTWSHRSLDTPQSQVLSWRDPGLSWRPVIEEVPIPHVLIERWNTLQYNISQYFPDDVTVRWYRKERGGQEYVPLSHHGKYQIPDIQHHRQTDLTFSCTARLLYKPSVGDRGSEIMCTVSHPSLEEPTERRSGPLQVQAKPKVRKPIKPSLGPKEMIFSQRVESFYPETIQVEWCYWSGEEPVHSCQSQEKCITNINKTVSVTSECRVPEHLLCSPKFRVRVTWRHESMDEEEYREFSIRDRDFPWRPHMEMSVPPLRNGEEATIQCTVTRYFPDAVTVTWLRSDKQSGKLVSVSADGIYRITNTPLDRHNDKTYGCRSCVTFFPSVERDRGVEYICRVEHPSLEQPIERNTGELQVVALEQQKPCIEDPVQQPDDLVPDSQHSPPQEISNNIDYQHISDVPAPESNNQASQSVSEMGHHPGVPAPELHHQTSQDVSNMMSHKNQTSTPAPESLYSSLCDMIDDTEDMECTDYSSSPNVHKPREEPESHHQMSQNVSSMEYLHHYGALAPESHHQALHNAISKVRGQELHPGVPAPESHNQTSQYMSNMTGHQNHTGTPALEYPHSPSHDAYDDMEDMDYQDNSSSHNVHKHREEPAHS